MEGSSREYSHSEVLFTKENGAPLNFYMRPCEQRVELRRLIEYGGGEISSRIQPDSIRLFLSTDICFSDECYDSSYIKDCISNGCLLDLKDYKIKNSSEKEKTKTHFIRKRKKVRNAYTVEEDNVILMYVAEHPGLVVGGNRIWKQMADAKITIHTWQSMRDRYLKKLKDRLPEFKEIVKSRRLARSSFEDHEYIEAEDSEEHSAQDMQVGVGTDTEEDGTSIHVCKRKARMYISSDESTTESGTGKSNVETRLKTTQLVEKQTSGIPVDNIDQEIEAETEEDSSGEDVAQISRDMQKFMKKYGLSFEQCAYVYYINNTNTEEVTEWFRKLEQKEREALQRKI